MYVRNATVLRQLHTKCHTRAHLDIEEFHIIIIVVVKIERIIVIGSWRDEGSVQNPANSVPEAEQAGNAVNQPHGYQPGEVGRAGFPPLQHQEFVQLVFGYFALAAVVYAPSQAFRANYSGYDEGDENLVVCCGHLGISWKWRENYSNCLLGVSLSQHMNIHMKKPLILIEIRWYFNESISKNQFVSNISIIVIKKFLTRLNLCTKS